jgi:hypothetical protein
MQEDRCLGCGRLMSRLEVEEMERCWICGRRLGDDAADLVRPTRYSARYLRDAELDFPVLRFIFALLSPTIGSCLIAMNYSRATALVPVLSSFSTLQLALLAGYHLGCTWYCVEPLFRNPGSGGRFVTGLILLGVLVCWNGIFWLIAEASVH